MPTFLPTKPTNATNATNGDKMATKSEMAERLFLSKRTVEGYRKTLLSKLGAKNSAGLMLKAIKENIIKP